MKLLVPSAPFLYPKGHVPFRETNIYTSHGNEQFYTEYFVETHGQGVPCLHQSPGTLCIDTMNVLWGSILLLQMPSDFPLLFEKRKKIIRNVCEKLYLCDVNYILEWINLPLKINFGWVHWMQHFITSSSIIIDSMCGFITSSNLYCKPYEISFNFITCF